MTRVDPAALREVFDQAVSLPAEDRNAFLNRACGSNVALRHEAERLLAAHPSAFDLTSAEDVDEQYRPPASRRLPPGTRLGPYVVESLLGAGGMGEVYRGRDPRLDREVAIKVLPAAGLADAERRRRFRQEARAASALNHPHIVTIYEIETADGTDFIVMEFVRGKGLDALIPRKGMRLGEVLRIGIAVADALAAAHERGIVHRDLKPANVMIGTDGGVKVVDFGLAKLRVGDDRSRDETNTLTTGVSVSAAGVIAGTAAYMSPEQAMGEEVDARSDIFSFGAMLYEMATGVRAFAAASAVEILSAVVRAQPRPPTQIVATVPSDLERVILRCLRKDRDRRFQTIRDVAVELREIKDESDSGQLRVRAGADRRPVGTLVNTTTRWALLGLLAIVAAVGVWRVTLRRPQPEQPLNEPRLVRVTAQPAADPVRTACVSPDGRYVAFSDSAGVHVRVTASGEAHLIPFTENMDVFAWSSDGSTIKAGRSDGRTYVSWDVPLLPGPPRQTGVRWPASDIVAFSPDSATIARLADNGEIWLQRLDGSATNIVYRTGEGVNDRTRVSALAWMYDGSGILFANAFAGPQVYVLSSNQSSPSMAGRVAANSTITGLIQLPNGHILASGYGREGSALWDLGEAGQGAIARRLSAFNEGVPILLSASHDGRWLAFQLERQQGDVYTAEFDASKERIDTPRRLTLDERDDLPTAWTPDGKAVLFFSSRNGPLHIFKQMVGDATAEQLVGGSVDNVDPRVSSDGQWIYFQQASEAGAPRSSHIMRIPIDGGQPEHVHTYSGGAVPRCAAHGPCIVFQFQGDHVAVRALEAAGANRELLRFTSGAFGADVLPSGEGVAFIVPDALPRNRIQIRRFDGRPPTEISVSNASALANLDWLADATGLLTTNLTATHTDLLFVRPDGRSTVLWSGDASAGVWAAPSRDSKRLALFMKTRQSDAFLSDLGSTADR